MQLALSIIKDPLTYDSGEIFLAAAGSTDCSVKMFLLVFAQNISRLNLPMFKGGHQKLMRRWLKITPTVI